MHSQAVELKSMEQIIAQKEKEKAERIKAKAEKKETTTFEGMSADIKRREVLNCFNTKFRQKETQPADVRKALDSLVQKIAIDESKVELIQMEQLVENLAIALQDLSNKEEFLEILTAYQQSDSLTNLVGDLKRPGGVCEKGKTFFEKFSDKREMLKINFEAQIKKYSDELTQKLIKQAEDQYKTRKDLFVHFIATASTYLDKQWTEQVRPILYSSQNYDDKAIFNSAELAEKKFKKVSKGFKELYQLVDDIISIKLKKDAEIDVMQQLVQSAQHTILSFPETSLAEIQQIMSVTFGALAKNDALDLQVRKQFQSLEKKYQKQLKSALALTNRA